jgi:hypothetical protein
MRRMVAVAALSVLLQAAPSAGFRGSWKVTELMVPQAPDYRVPRVNYPEGLPGVGSVVQFSGKRMCVISYPCGKPRLVSGCGPAGWSEMSHVGEIPPGHAGQDG